MASKKSRPASPALLRLDARHRQTFALLAGAIAFLSFTGPWSLARGVWAWNCYAAVELIFCWLVILRRHPGQIKSEVTVQDSGQTALFAFVLSAACASLLAVLFILQEKHHLHEAEKFALLTQAILTVAESWTLAHTLFTLRYAHLYYRPGGADSDPGRGLKFSGTTEPDYLDFAYFSFVIGMTCQTSDTAVNSRVMRRLSLLHGVIAFIFNTAIVALSINILASLV